MRGSALLIALFIMASAGAVTFSSARLLISELKSNTNISGSTEAFYGAEGALETSLLELSKNHLIQWGGEAGCTTPTTNLTNCKVSGNDPLYDLTNAGIWSNGQKMYTRISFLGNTITNQYLGQDQSADINLPVLSAGTSASLNWTWVCPTEPDNPNLSCAIKSATPATGQGGVRIESINPNTGAILGGSLSPPSSSSTGLTQYANSSLVRFRPLGGSINYNVIISPTNSESIDTAETTITAKGVSAKGDVSRQLKVVIKSQKKKLDSLFDYVLLSKDSL